MTSTRTARRPAGARADAIPSPDTVVAGVYLRISFDRDKDEHGVQTQRPEALKLAAGLGWHVPDWAVYMDNDKSASKKHVVRPEYERMLADIQAGRIQAISATFPDRIYRRLDELERLIGIVEDNHTAIRTAHSGEIDLTSATGRMVARIIGAIAQGEGEVKAERVALAYAANRKKGKMPGGVRLFGYNSDGTIRQDEAAAMRQVVAGLLAGGSKAAAAHELHALGFMGTKGHPWQLSALDSYLRNPRIAGHSVYKGRIVGRGQWEPVIQDETWQTLVAVLDKLYQARGRHPRKAVLSGGLIVCGRCGEPLTSGRFCRKGKPSRRLYKCSQAPAAKQRGSCGAMSVYAEEVELIVERAARKRLADPKVRSFFEREQRDAGTKRHTSELADLEERLAEVEELMRQPKARSKRSVERLEETADELDGRIAELRSRLAGQHTLQQVKLPTHDEWPAADDLMGRRRLIELVVQRVVIQPGRGGKFDPKRVTIIGVPMEGVPPMPEHDETE